MKPVMTIELARAAATDAGRRNAIANGRPPTPWALADRDAASLEFLRLCRIYKLEPFKLPENNHG